MVIKNNMSSYSTLNMLNDNSSKLSKALKQAATGVKLNSAGDGTSDYSIAAGMRVQLRCLSQDYANAYVGEKMLSIAEGGVQNIIENLRFIKEKALNAANDTNTDSDRAIIQKEVQQRLDEIDDIASETNYNGKYLLNGNFREVKTAGYSIANDANNNPIRQNTVTNLLANFSIVGSTMTAGGAQSAAIDYTDGGAGVTGTLNCSISYTTTSAAATSKNDGKLKVDFSGAVSAGGSKSYPATFNGQGFAIACTA